MHSASILSARSALKAVIAEDDELLREVVALQMEALGCEVAQACNGADALEHVAANETDLLITDWQMPGMDGMELVRLARAACSRERHLHIAMMTARGDEVIQREALNAGVDDFLFKPIAPVELELALETARRNRLLHRRLQRRNTLLTTAHERMREALESVRQDLAAATALHERLLPDTERIGGLGVHHVYRPAALLGGDSIGVSPLREGGLLFFVIDVKGHGVPAALDSFHLHHRIKQLRPTTPDELSRALATINSEICLRQDESYATIACGLLNPGWEEGWITCAGHPPPLIGVGEDVRFFEGGRAMPVGWIESEDFAPARFDFPFGARLLVYSDGVTDCTNSAGEEFGVDRLRNTLAYNVARPMAAVVRSIEYGLIERQSAGGFEDDVSLLAIEYDMMETI
jgi:phosphoserine phosphatase RsbU/P